MKTKFSFLIVALAAASMLCSCDGLKKSGSEGKKSDFYIEDAGCDLNLKMIRVEGDTFPMGSYAGDADEQPVHNVTLDTYYIGECEITQEQWWKIMNSNPSQFSDGKRPSSSTFTSIQAKYNPFSIELFAPIFIFAHFTDKPKSTNSFLTISFFILSNFF